VTLQILIIEGSQHSRRLNASESRPRSLDIVGGEDRPLLDWILHGVKELNAAGAIYAGGYHIEKVIRQFPHLDVRSLPENERASELAALIGCAPASGALLVLSAGTILLPGASARIVARGTARGVYDGGKSAGIYAIAAGRVGDALDLARTLAARNAVATLDDLFSALSGVETVELDGLAAPVTDREAVARTIFRGKAQTLDNLTPHVRSACHVPRERVLVGEWQRDPDAVLQRISARFPDTVLVVRSSTSSEDGLHASGAGKFLSILDVPSSNMGALRKALDEVVASYGRERDPDDSDEVLVQPQLRNIISSGVMLTRDPRSGAPYFVINEDRTSGRSDTVTGGGKAILEQQFVAWPAAASPALDKTTRALTILGAELAQLSTLDALDVEYAFDRAGDCHLLQVRPLAAVRQYSQVADEDVFELIAGAQEFARERMRPSPTLLGKTTILGVMPDWNPAEMIGTAPRPLALSLYQRLIGNTAWAEARRRIGYRDLRSEQLILSLAGRPFVDVRASLNSFLPASLDDATGARWVDACLERLRGHPRFHDKLEFEVAITCLAPDFESHAPRLREAGLDDRLVREHLRRLTAGVLRGETAPIAQQYEHLAEMNARRARIVSDVEDGVHGLARSISQLLGDCRDYGVVPFSILARYGFIAMSLLRGMVAENVIERRDYDAFLQDVPTVAGGMTEDLAGDLPLDELVERYGHLRPNSYELTSPNYAADAAQFLRPGAAPSHKPQADAAAALEHHRGAIDKMLAGLGLDVGFDQLTGFLGQAIAGREKAKFEFMKNLDAALERVARLGDRIGLDREKLSFLPISEILRLETDSLADADRSQMQRRIAYNEKRWSVSRQLRMPDLVRTPDEVAAFRMESWRINFVTANRVVARAVWLDDVEGQPDLKDAIVVLRAADPGYDWIFAHGIAGLVTEYGGVASHMAIRSAEFGLPAAIGCGALVLESLRGAASIELDCAAERVRAA
jgi:hypothetical protein